MRVFLAKTRQWLRQHFWHPIRASVDLFHLLPQVAAVAIFLLLASVGQTYELYYSYIETQQFLPVLSAVFALAILSAALYASHYWLSRIRENVIFKTYRRPKIGINYRLFRRLAGFALALSPWLGLAVGLAVSDYNIIQREELLNSTRTLLDAPLQPEPEITLVVGMAIVSVILVGIAIVTLIHRLRRSNVALVIFLVLSVVLIALAALTPRLADNPVTVYRALGPLATMSIGILFFYSIAALFALFSQRSKYPALSLVVAALVIGGIFKFPFAHLTFVLFMIFAGFAALAAFARLWWTVYLASLVAIGSFVASYRDAGQTAVWNYDPNIHLADAKPPPKYASAAMDDIFDKWLRSRKTDGAKFTVFIVAIEGGGIYAAAAAALFLAKLQDDSPDFGKHVFAISAVSGGAIGATIFQALSHSPGPSPFAGCGIRNPPKGNLQHEITCVMLDDHFSPVVGSIVPDLLGERMGRAQELEASFLNSVSSVNASARNRLEDWYISHWSSDDDSDKWSDDTGPALVLNTTSAETGYRVAFAPFSLNTSGDKTVFSFSDADLTSAFADPSQSGESVSLMFAAIASARFPGILPPFAISLRTIESSKLYSWWDGIPVISKLLERFANGDSGNRWNFVDGGYADNSGAATALSLYVALADKLKARDDVDLKLILLTSDDPMPVFRSIRGTTYGDTVAPIEAVLSVRAGLANQAVTRACDYFKQQPDADLQEPPCEEAKSEGARKSWKMKVIKLQDQAYGLALGWKISRSSFNVVQDFVGHTDYCDRVIDDKQKVDKQALDTAKAIVHNSCVLKDIEVALKPAFR